MAKPRSDKPEYVPSQEQIQRMAATIREQRRLVGMSPRLGPRTVRVYKLNMGNYRYVDRGLF